MAGSISSRVTGDTAPLLPPIPRFEPLSLFDGPDGAGLGRAAGSPIMPGGHSGSPARAARKPVPAGDALSPASRPIATAGSDHVVRPIGNPPRGRNFGIRLSPERRERIKEMMDDIKARDPFEEAGKIVRMILMVPKNSRTRGANETSGGYFSSANYDTDGEGRFGRR